MRDSQSRSQFRGFEGKRRIVSFGWRYDYNDHKILPADPIPTFLLEVYRTIQATSGFVLCELQQVLVSEYAPGAPIGWHKDRPVFGDVMGLSLASSCIVSARKPLNGNQCGRGPGAGVGLSCRVRCGGNGNTAFRL